MDHSLNIAQISVESIAKREIVVLINTAKKVTSFRHTYTRCSPSIITLHSSLNIILFQKSLTVLCLYCLHQLTRFFLFTSRIRSFFFSSLLRYPAFLKILFTVLSDSLLAPFSLETFVNSVKVLRRLFFTSRISCLSPWTLHLRGLPLRFLFSVTLRLSCRFKKNCIL